MGDICEIDADGYLSVTGRTSDFILRGGKNISASAVEDAATTHPAIAVAAAVAMPDPLFGENVCLFAELVGRRRIDLSDLVDISCGRCFQGAAARATHRGRRVTAIVGRQDRQKRASRRHQIHTGADHDHS